MPDRPVSLSTCAFFLLVWLAVPRLAMGQDARGFIGGALTRSSWRVEPVNGGSPSQYYDNTSTDDSLAFGVTVDGAWSLTPRFAIGAELGVPARREVTQTFSYFNAFIRKSQYRDLTLFAIARGRIQAPHRIGVEVLGGGGGVQQSSAAQVSESMAGAFSPLGPFMDVPTMSRWTWGFTGGVDVSVGVARHISIVPQVRVLVINRGNIENGVEYFSSFGLAKTVYRYGLGLRAAF
jgi:hypothetical protein